MSIKQCQSYGILNLPRYIIDMEDNMKTKQKKW